jgi:hypothetical protein
MPAKKAAEVDTRGELRVELEPGVEYGLRPDWQAIAGIERQLRPIRALYVEAQSLEMAIEDMALVTAELMKGYGRANPEDAMISTYRDSKPDRLAELIYEAGMPKVAIRLAIILGGALTGGYTASGEAKTPTKRKG